MAAQPPASPMSESQLDELARLLHEFISTPTLVGKQRLVEGSPLLLTQEADAALAGLQFQYSDDPQIERSLNLHRVLLQNSRAVGIREAFREARRLFDENPGAASLEEAQTQDLVGVIGEFVTAENWAEARRLLDAHPILLARRTDAVFEQLIQNHTARGQSAVVRALVVHRDLLRSCRELGVDEAFERMLNPPDTLDMIAGNTIAVLTNRTEELAGWRETVRLARIRAAELGDGQMLALLRAISRLLDGDLLPDDDPDFTGEYAACWRRILDSL
jgi:hypothetical protein